MTTPSYHWSLAPWEKGLLEIQAEILLVVSKHIETEVPDAEVGQQFADRAMVFELIAGSNKMPFGPEARKLMHQAYFDTATLLHNHYGDSVET